MGLVVQPNQTDSDYHKFFILDAGNNAIRTYEANKINHNINYLGTIYDDNNNDGHGPLRKARDLAYVYLPGASYGKLLVVADTYNHRVLVMKTDGDVIHEIGGPNPGSGAFEFKYPYSVTGCRLNSDNCEALIYIGDRGNNRIVCLYQDEGENIHWYRTLDLPIDSQMRQIGDFPIIGIEDVEVDDFLYDGVWVLDSRQKGVIQFDQFIEQKIQYFNGMDYKGSNLVDLSLHNGEMSILGPYTKDSGLELFEVKSSFRDLDSYPNPFNPHFEWLTVKFISTGHGWVDAWIENSSGTTILSKENFADEMFAYPAVNYLVWDGLDNNDQLVPSGEYTIYLSLSDQAWDYSEITSISVKVEEGNVKVLATHPVIADPKWSPDGSYIAYMADDDTDYHGRIVKINTEDLTETYLTDEGLGHRHPSWSPNGDKIAFTKYTEYMELWDYWEAGVFTMDSDGSNVEVASDTSETWNRATDPYWSRGGREISYVRCHKNANPRFCIRTYNFDSQERNNVYSESTNEVYIYKHLWSPLEDNIVISRKDAGTFYHLYNYDIETGNMSQVTFNDEEGADEEVHFTYAPDGGKLAFIEYVTYVGDGSWKILTVPSNGGTKIPISSLSSDILAAGNGISWSPDGTKITFCLESATNDIQLVLADYIRNCDSAFPAAFILQPYSGEGVSGIVAITGAVQDNISIDGFTVLSELSDYYIEYGAGKNPYTWNTSGIDLSADCSQGNCQIENDTLALWNTGLLEDGTYTLRLVASDGSNANTYCRHVMVEHNVITVKQDVSGDFTAIQAAIDSAQAGDTVLVYAGNYYEKVNMKEMVHLVGVGGGVRIIGGNDMAVYIYNHKYPCSIENIVIYNDGYYMSSRGIYIDNSSPVIKNCTIQNNGHQSSSIASGIIIINNSSPTFYNCTIRDNKSSKGGGVQLEAQDNYYPAPSFYNCSFINNFADGYGGAIYLDYSYITPLDDTHIQPYFSRCIFKNNATISNGSAVFLGCCHAPMFTHCEFSDNHPQAYDGSPLFGMYAGARFNNCTFYDNDGENDGSVLEFLNLSTVGYDAIQVNNCIFANNCITAINGGDDYHDVNYSCFYENDPADTAWMNRGEGNFMEDPAFCDRQNNNLSLYSFSPCSPAVSDAGLIGAYGVECAPSCDLVSIEEDSLNVCPAGDWDALEIVISFDDNVMTRDIDSTEIQLKLPSTDVRFFPDGPIYANGPATSANGWTTTFNKANISGCVTGGFVVILDNVPVCSLTIDIKSVDYNKDGYVNVSDLAFLGQTYNECYPHELYNECFNYDRVDSCVLMNELALFTLHYSNCYYDGGTSVPGQMLARNALISDINIKFIIQDFDEAAKKIDVLVALEHVKDLNTMIVGIAHNTNHISLIEWEQNTELPNTAITYAIDSPEKERLYIALFGDHIIHGDYIELGTMVLATNAPNGIMLAENVFSIIGGEILTSEGTIFTITNTETEERMPKVPLVNKLFGNYPNPFNPTTVISYSIATNSHVNIFIYNVNGQLVRTLVNELQEADRYRVNWDGKDNRGAEVASGVYFYKIKAGTFEDAKKLIILR